MICVPSTIDRISGAGFAASTWNVTARARISRFSIPSLRAAFPTDEAVNDALRSLIQGPSGT